MSRYGLVYMGSKEHILSLIRYILDRHYEADVFVDLFAGGFSVSGYSLFNSKKKVIANDLNKYIMDLYNKIILKDTDIDKKLFEWVSRERFEDVRDFPSNYPNWYVGYVLNVWSFGCNQKDYLYARDLEEGKRAIHELLVNGNDKFLKDLTVEYRYQKTKLFEGFVIPETIYKKEYHRDKRLIFFNKMRDFAEGKNSYIKRWLERLNKIENLTQLEHVLNMRKYQSFTDQLEIHSKDYLTLYNELHENNLLENAVIYCDPPYENTKQYRFGRSFDYKEFWEWFENSPYPIYVSSYKAPRHIKPLNFELKVVKLDNGRADEERYAPKKKAVENLYWNGKGDYIPTMEDLLFNS